MTQGLAPAPRPATPLPVMVVWVGTRSQQADFQRQTQAVTCPAISCGCCRVGSSRHGQDEAPRDECDEVIRNYIDESIKEKRGDFCPYQLRWV